MKHVPHCSFSDFEQRAATKNPATMKSEFEDIPNYHLTGKSFDVRHLDRFISRVNVRESNARTSLGLGKGAYENENIYTQ